VSEAFTRPRIDHRRQPAPKRARSKERSARGSAAIRFPQHSTTNPQPIVDHGRQLALIQNRVSANNDALLRGVRVAEEPPPQPSTHNPQSVSLPSTLNQSADGRIRHGEQPSTSPLPSPPLKLLDRVRWHLRVKRYSIRTEQAYVDWIRRYILFHKKRHPEQMGPVKAFAHVL
jgi:Phage integrase, N-terminal SAM-like domain